MPNPGSLNEFMQANGIENVQEALAPHSEALQGYRQELAAEKGIDMVDLHRAPQALGKLVVPEPSYLVN